jgi:hypothetical protein
MVDFAARIAGGHRDDAGQLLEGRLHAPEAPACEGGARGPGRRVGGVRPDEAEREEAEGDGRGDSSSGHGSDPIRCHGGAVVSRGPTPWTDQSLRAFNFVLSFLTVVE